MWESYKQLTKVEQHCYTRILQAIQNGESNVTLCGALRIPTFEKIMVALNYDHPELFYTDFQRIHYEVTPMRTIVNISYIASHAVRNAIIEQVNKQVVAAVQSLNISNSDSIIVRCKKIHNYLVHHTNYDYAALSNPQDHPESFSIYGVFDQNLAVCAGIAKAFKLLCDKVGVEASIVEGTSSQQAFGQNIPHTWNIVKISSDYAHVDVTWDLGLSNASEFIRYDYFLIPDEWIKVDHKFKCSLRCTTTKYSAFAQKNRIFCSSNELQEYVKETISSNHSILYFKITTKTSISDNIAGTIQNLVERCLKSNFYGTYSIRMMPNDQQQIYFFKICH